MSTDERAFVAIDEVQNLYTHESYGKEAAKLVLDIIRLGRAFGVILIQATQRPDADSLPKAISSNAGIRIGLRVMDDYANNAILGSGMYAAGIRATTFTAKDKGVGYLVGVADEAIVAKSYNVTGPMAERITERARRLREQAGRLTGHAIGQDPADVQVPTFDLLVDVRAVMVGQSAQWMWNASAAGALAVLRPDAYAGLTAELLGKMLAARGVRTRAMFRTDSEGQRRNLTGFELGDITEKIAKRRRQDDAG